MDGVLSPNVRAKIPTQRSVRRTVRLKSAEKSRVLPEWHHTVLHTCITESTAAARVVPETSNRGNHCTCWHSSALSAFSFGRIERGKPALPPRVCKMSATACRIRTGIQLHLPYPSWHLCCVCDIPRESTRRDGACPGGRWPRTRFAATEMASDCACRDAQEKGDTDETRARRHGDTCTADYDQRIGDTPVSALRRDVLSPVADLAVLIFINPE